MVVAEAMMGVSAFKAAMDITKGLKDIDDRTRRNEAVIELQEKILGAQSAQAALVEKVSDLEKEMARLKAWDAEKQRYKLEELRPGVVAYSLKEDMANGEPAHKLCTACYEVGFKSFLKPETWDPGRCNMIVCHGCGWFSYLSGAADPSHKNNRPTPYRGD
jgi:hypothetical protein